MVYAKPPFAGAERVWNMSDATHTGWQSPTTGSSISRMARYAFSGRDYRNENRQKLMTLEAGEFIRRFLVHVLPEGFQRIPYYGFLGNRYRKQKLARCRELLGMQQSNAPVKPKEGHDYRDRVEELTGVSLRECPFCRQGQMVCIEVLAHVASQRPTFSGHFMTSGFFNHCSFYLPR